MSTSLLRRQAARALDAFPRTWHNVQVLRYRNSRVLHNLATPEHDVVLEGFPRSGNSFAVRYFRQANSHIPVIAIATHSHCIAQLRLAIRYRLPTIVFIREPVEAVTSFTALRIINGATSEAAGKDFLTDKMRYYIDYYRFLETIKERVVLSSFETTTGNISVAIAAMNDRFKSEFRTRSAHEDEVERIFSTSRAHLAPNEQRSIVKTRVRAYLEDATIARLAERATDIFQTVKQAAV